MNEDLVSLRILLASDTEAERAILRQVLAQASVPIDLTEVEAGDGRTVCHQAIRHSWDVILLDSRIPRTGRVAVIEAIRFANGHPLLVLIGPAEIKTREVITDGLVFDDVLGKPIDTSEVLNGIQRWTDARLPRRALIVDDSATVRAIVRKLLSASRFSLEVEEAVDGDAALELARSRHFNIAFLDWNMPGRNGLEVLSELRNVHPKLKVVIMTGSVDVGLVNQAREAGAQDILSKPFYPTDVDLALHRLFGLRNRSGGSEWK